jgi:hypothetical protein
LGVYNGNTINNPQWSEKMSIAGRLTLGGMKGWRSTMKIYDYPNSPDIHYLLYGADLRYASDNWKIETEIMKRDDKVKGEICFCIFAIRIFFSFERFLSV